MVSVNLMLRMLHFSPPSSLWRPRLTTMNRSVARMPVSGLCKVRLLAFDRLAFDPYLLPSADPFTELAELTNGMRFLHDELDREIVDQVTGKNQPKRIIYLNGVRPLPFLYLPFFCSLRPLIDRSTVEDPRSHHRHRSQLRSKRNRNLARLHPGSLPVWDSLLLLVPLVEETTTIARCATSKLKCMLPRRISSTVSRDNSNSIECNSGRRWSSLSSWVRRTV